MRNDPFFPAVILDLDGVVTSFVPTFIEAAVKTARHHDIEIDTDRLSPEDVRTWEWDGLGVFPDPEKKKEHLSLYWKEFNAGNWWRFVRPFGGAVRVINNWLQLGVPVYFLTHRPIDRKLVNEWFAGLGIGLPTENRLIVVNEPSLKVEHVRTITQRHGRSLFFDDYAPTINAVYEAEVEGCELFYVVNTYSPSAEEIKGSPQRCAPLWDGSRFSIASVASARLYTGKGLIAYY
jgi:hypothetical protein